MLSKKMSLAFAGRSHKTIQRINHHNTASITSKLLVLPSRPHYYFHTSTTMPKMATKKSSVPSWATLDPEVLGVNSKPHHVHNVVGGKWNGITMNVMEIPNPMDKDSPPVCTIPDTNIEEIGPYVDSLKAVSKSGVHNPLKNVERYLMYGEISRRAGNALSDPYVEDFFTKSIMKCVPKSYAQAKGEVTVTAAFLNNFAGDNVRFLSRSFGNPGDYDGQQSNGYRWPYGPVAIIAPFNFPLEIPVLQLMGALFMGNKPVIKPAEKCALVMEQFLHLLHHCGMPKSDVDMLNCQGPVAEKLITTAPVRLTQFTGSTRVAELLSERTAGRIKIEDAGFDWKILGPDVSDVDHIAWQCDQDAYASQGQKCSAQSIMFVHENWANTGLVEKMKANAATRTLDDLTIGPVLTHTNSDIDNHINRLLRIAGAKILFGGKPLTNHNIPECYGAFEPTAVFVPLKELLKDEHYDACTTELFAPFQVVTQYANDEVDLVIEACERMSHHLTAAIVSNDAKFVNKVLPHTVNGTTYVGKRARTTGAPQNHWFGPCGDPRGAGIGTADSIKYVWSCHREIIHDNLIPDNWAQPKAT